MSTFKKQGANKDNTKIDRYFRRLEKSSPVKRKAVHDENSPPSPKKRQFGDLKANNTKLKQHSIRLPLRDMNPQRKLSSTFPRPATKPSFTILTDDAIKKGITSTVVKNKTEVKKTQATSKVEKEQETPKEETSKEETPKEETLKEELLKEESEDSDDDLFTKTTNSSVKFMPLDLSSSISDFENSSPTDDFSSDQEEPVLFVDPDLEFSLSEISSLPKTKQKFAPEKQDHGSEETPKKEKKVPKKQATLEDMMQQKDIQKQEETQEIEADEGKTLPSLEPESVSQIMIPYANPRGKDLVEKLDVNDSNKVTEEEDNDH